MGKGDKKSRRGKIVIGTYGVRRLKRKKSAVTTDQKALTDKPSVKKPAAKEAEPKKKAAAKKAVPETVEETKPSAKKKSAGKAVTETKKTKKEKESAETESPKTSES